MFFQLMIAMMMGLMCPSTSHNTHHTYSASSVQDETDPDDKDTDTGGDTGHNPPPK